MFRILAQRYALVFALLLLTVPTTLTQAQSAVVAPDAVTGGDPQPTGEPPAPPKPKTSVAMPVELLTALIVLGLA